MFRRSALAEYLAALDKYNRDLREYAEAISAGTDSSELRRERKSAGMLAASLASVTPIMSMSKAAEANGMPFGFLGTSVRSSPESLRRITSDAGVGSNKLTLQRRLS